MKQQLKSIAEGLFITGKTLVEISQVIHVSQVTLSKWKKKHNWDVKRESWAGSDEEIIISINKEIKRLLDQTSEGGMDASVADSLSKLVKIKESLGKRWAEMVVLVMGRFQKYFMMRPDIDDNVSEKLKELIDDFFNTLEEE